MSDVSSILQNGIVAHDLRLRIDEAQETLGAIRAGEVDAVVVAAGGEQRVFVLRGADHAHRILLETLNEGAMTIAADSTILFANRKLAEMIGRPLSKVLGSRLDGFVPPEEAHVLVSLLERGAKASAKGELSLVTPNDERVPVMVSIRDAGEAETTFTVVATDLTPLKAAQAALERAKDELEERVEARTMELLEVNSALHAEIERRERLEHELRSKAEALLEADRRKDEFLSMLAHELRNPLAPILTAAEMIRHATRGDTTVERCRSVIDRQARNLARLVDDLLDVSRITRGAITLQKKLVDLGSVVHSAVDAARPLVDAGRHELIVTCPATPVYVLADPTRLEQILVNLLNNAAKYTMPGGKIRFSVDSSDGDVTVRVEDNGVGMPPDLLPRVFDLFVQGNRSLDRAQGGLGIGLTLVKSLVTMHGGAVEARSDGVGRGSELVVRLPLANSEAGTGVAKASAPIPGMTASDEARRALVVEDNVDAAEMLADLLAFWGYDVRAVRSGEAGVEVAGAFNPHVVLLDIGLPGMDGFEVARRLRSMPRGRPEGRPLPLLIGVSGYGQEADRRRAREAGIDYHLIKPLDPKILRELLTLVDASRGKHAP
jgi:PAS domain S-box-containing protein